MFYNMMLYFVYIAVEMPGFIHSWHKVEPDMKTFIIVFALVLLFVIGSASAMRYFGNRSMPAKKDPEEEKDEKKQD